MLFEVYLMKYAIQPTAAITMAGTTITDMATIYSFNARKPWRKLPVPPHTANGMIITIAAMAATVFRKVSIPT